MATETDIRAVRGDIETALWNGHEALANGSLQHHWELQRIIRGDINLPAALARVIRDHATRQNITSDEIPIGKDVEKWDIYGSIEDEDTEHSLTLVKRQQSWLHKSSARVCIMGIDGKDSLAGRNDTALVSRYGKNYTFCDPFQSSPDYAARLALLGPNEETMKHVWAAYQNKEHTLRDYLSMVVELGYGVLHATREATISGSEQS